jgi:preprotein translocase subunit SecF
MIEFVKRQGIFLTLSGIVVGIAVALMILWGITLGIDFTGGSLMQIRFSEAPPAPADIQQLLDVQVAEVRAQPLGEDAVFLRMSPLSNDEREQVLTALRDAYGEVEEESFSSIGPTIGKELQQRALLAIVVVILGIILYITWAFRRVSAGPVPAWAFGVGAIVALIHDIMIPLGLYAVLGKFFGVEADTLFVTALLTILGFSVHDTIVVYDRIRENLRTYSGEPFSRIVNHALNETILRSVNTSLTTLLVLAALFIFGGESVRYFVLTLGIGIAVGTYSSIFIAGPLLVLWARRKGEE